MSTKELLALARKEKLVASYMPDIMKAVKLKPLPRLCTRAELGRCLRKRFNSDADILPKLVYQDCITPANLTKVQAAPCLLLQGVSLSRTPNSGEIEIQASLID